MDRIEANSNFSQIHRSPAPLQKASNPVEKVEPSKESAYSDIFKIGELDLLQNNLQSVANLATKALERFKK